MHLSNDLSFVFMCVFVVVVECVKTDSKEEKEIGREWLARHTTKCK